MHERRRMRAATGCRKENGEEAVVYPRAVRLGAAPECAADVVKSRRRRSVPNRCDEEIGREILDIFLCKNKFVTSNDGGVPACSPPFCASPPSRAGNPIVKDVRFMHERGSTRLGGTAGMVPCQTIYATCTTARSVPSVRVEGFFSPSSSNPAEARCLPVQCA